MILTEASVTGQRGERGGERESEREKEKEKEQIRGGLPRNHAE